MAADKDWVSAFYYFQLSRNHLISQQAQKHLIDPLYAPDPSDETGPGAHFRSTFAAQPADSFSNLPDSLASKKQTPSKLPQQVTGSSRSSTNPFRRSTEASPQGSPSHVKQKSMGDSGYPSPPTSASPRRNQFPSYREEAFSSFDDGQPRERRSVDQPRSPTAGRGHRPRTSSLGERFPGDKSHKPLDIIRRESKKAYRSPHLKKHHIPGADTIDKLDDTGNYHHEGPYDAVLSARNRFVESSPVAAVANSNREALEATPPENILDAVTRHRPLDGTATVPSGQSGLSGKRFKYEEDNVIGSDYKRWSDIEYHPDDLKGKGEPFFTIDRALKQDKHRRRSFNADDGIEMTTRSHGKSTSHADEEPVSSRVDGIGRSNTTGRKVDGLRKRWGSLRRKKDGN
ncbi:hypothetical protein M501DRAFT_939872 [Patellaria atrata CBS 101060]|uniref:Pal1-domain-containing protein n=1 Tax=Patellaria atrata CBS 101060 TaxID=1346257 RepID=A0A9P4S523_9PEZI|nr:hypothetical protein M501DRAFT_939872 [Patellaria atrata CBS 101060]